MYATPAPFSCVCMSEDHSDSFKYWCCSAYVCFRKTIRTNCSDIQIPMAGINISTPESRSHSQFYSESVDLVS